MAKGDWSFKSISVDPTEAIELLKQPRWENPRKTPLQKGTDYKGVFKGFAQATEFTSTKDASRTFKAVAVIVEVVMPNGVQKYTLSPEVGVDYTAIFSQPDTKIMFDIALDDDGNKSMTRIRVDA